MQPSVRNVDSQGPSVEVALHECLELRVIGVAVMAKTVEKDYCELLAIEREEVWGRSA